VTLKTAEGYKLRKYSTDWKAAESMNTNEWQNMQKKGEYREQGDLE